VCFVSGGMRLISSNDRGGVRIWDTGTGRLLLTLDDPVHGGTVACVAPDGRTVFGRGADLVSRLWQASEARDE